MATESGGAEKGYLHRLLADGAQPGNPQSCSMDVAAEEK